MTIEPAQQFYEAAAARFKGNNRVTVEFGTSEQVLPRVLSSLGGRDVTFWLDGHWSGGETFKGQQHTPIWDELDAVSASASSLGKLAILIDDARCFDPSDPTYAEYPTRGYLAAWAELHHMRWTIEHDIFVIY